MPITLDGTNGLTFPNSTVQAYVDSQAYIAKRQAAYPPASDYLDAVVKGDQVAIDKYVADCLAVKAKFPKG